MTVYATGDWFVKPGLEEAFAAKWRELTDLSVAEIEPGARTALMRDRENPRHFRSFGEFRNEEAIVRWRDGTMLGEHLRILAPMLDEGNFGLFNLVDATGFTAPE